MGEPFNIIADNAIVSFFTWPKRPVKLREKAIINREFLNKWQDIKKIKNNDKSTAFLSYQKKSEQIGC